MIPPYNNKFTQRCQWTRIMTVQAPHHLTRWQAPPRRSIFEVRFRDVENTETFSETTCNGRDVLSLITKTKLRRFERSYLKNNEQMGYHKQFEKEQEFIYISDGR